MKQEQFTVDYFIKKFEAIPEEKWFVGDFYDLASGAMCVNGQLGLRSISDTNKESISFKKLFDNLIVNHKDGSSFCFATWINPNYPSKAAEINNGDCEQYQQPTPKQRVLAALYDIKKMQTPIEQDEVKETIRYVTVEVDKEVKQLTKQQILN